MSIADEIINGTYGNKNKKKKKSIADSIINGTYEPTTFSISNNKKEIAPVKTTATTKKEEEHWIKQILQKPEAFKDGYQFGDVTKTIGGTIADLGMSFIKAPIGIGENIGTGLASGVAQVADWIGQDEYADKVRNKIATKEAPLGKMIREGKESVDNYSVTGDTGDMLSEGAGYLTSLWAGGQVGGAIGGALGKGATATAKATQLTRDALMFGSSAGSTFKESYQKENVEDWQVWAKAIGSGYLTAKIEKLGGVFGSGSIDTKVANAISSKIMNGAGKLATRMGVTGFSEMAEEFLEYAGNQGLDLIIDKVNSATSKNDATYLKEWDWDEVGQNMFAGFVLGSGAKGLQIAGDVSKNMKSNNMSLKEAINETARAEDTRGQLEALEDKKASLEEELGSKKLTQTEIGEIFDEMQKVDTEIKALTKPSNTVPTNVNAQQQLDLQEKVEQPNAQQFTEEIEQPNRIKEQAQQEATQELDAPVKETVQTDAPDIKTKQLDIIQKNNPMTDDYHTGIRSVEDIKTFDETINDDESFVWGDFSQEDAKKAIEKGTVTVYSSKPIEQGAFVSTSQNQARDYAGNGKIYSQEVNLSDVAWINGDEGQYAKVEEVDAPVQEVKTEVVENKEQDTQSIADKEMTSVKEADIKTVSTGHSDGENFYTMSYIQDGKEVGTIEYGEYNGKPNIKMIEVKPEYRRQGIATKLLQNLQKKYPDKSIDFGYSTEDGTKLLNNITYEVENKEYTKTQKQLEKVTNRINEIETNNVWNDDIDAEYYKLLDKQRKLDKKLFDLEVDGQNKTDRFVKLEEAQQTENVQNEVQKKTDTPTQQEIDNLLDIQKNKSGSEYGLAFDELRKKYGYSNLYKALNEEYSRQKKGTKEIAAQVEEVIAPLQEKIENLTEQLDTVVSSIEDMYAPTKQDIQNSKESLIHEEAPLQSGLTEQEQLEKDAYDEHIEQNGIDSLDEDSRKRYEYLQGQNVEEINTDETKVKDPLEDRNIEEVGNRKVKAYQYENPEVRPYFQEEAKIMLQELSERLEGKRYPIIGTDGYTDHWAGQQRVLVEDIAQLKDEYKLKYSDIEKGLNNIIKDDGAENNAVSKRLEFLINDRLLKGYTTVEGYQIPPNQEYVNFLKAKQITEYTEEAYKEWQKSLDNVEPPTEAIEEVTLVNEIAPTKETAQNPFKLTDEQNAKIQELRDDTKKWAEIYKERYDDPKFAEKRIKGVAMQNAAEIRKVIQGEALINIEGGLTETELANKISKLRSNYIGKQVSVNGKEGTITGNSFGKIGVEFTDGTKEYVDKSLIQPLEDIDSIIQEQQRTYEQYNIAPEPQKATIEQPKTEVKEIAPSTEKVAQNENTDVPETKLRSWVKTSTESEVVNGEIDIKDLDNVTYEVKSNKKTLDTANAKLEQNGYNNSVDYFNSKLMDKKVSVEDIVLGERLIQEALKKGDKKTAAELIENVSILGTELGQKIQALSIIQKLRPEGQLRVLEKVVQRGKTKGDKAFENVQITQEMKEKILSVVKSDGTYDQLVLNEVVEQVKQEIADQMETTLGDKLNAWRYLAMLGNPKTHIRNLISNVAMKGTTAVKNAMARTIEDLAPIKDKTKTWKKPSKDVLEYADRTTSEVKEILNGESSFSEDTSIKSKRKMFETKILEKIYNFNSDMLTKEDWWFKKPAFKNSFAEFLTANGIKTKDDIKNNYKIVEKAKLYAMEQAQIATFSQMSYLANKINEIENKNMAGKVIVGSIMPFKKTPINIAKAGLEYSPLGFAKTLTVDMKAVKEGNMEASQLIDNIAKNTTGSALVLVGYMLAQAGLLSGGGEDDKEGKYDSQLGDMTYSIKIGDTSYSLSWLSPVAMPLFVGANAFEKLVEQKEWNADVVMNTLAQTLDPLSEMSFLSGLTGVLSSYETGSMEQIKGMVESVGQNYLTQFVPTLSSQVAGTIDDTKRTTTETNASGSKFINTTINKLKYKIPGLRQTLEPSIDIWGNEVKQAETVGERAIDNFIAPYSKKKDITTPVDTELKEVYRETGENSVLPTSSISSNIDYKNEKYKMTNEEYTDFKKKYGQTAYEMLEELFETDTYAESDDTEKAKLISKVYEYAKDVSKKDYFDKHEVNYTNTTEDNIPVYKEKPIKNAIEYDMTPEEYSYFEENPAKYKTITAITDYETYKTYSKDISDLKGDKDRNGKTISNSRKNKVFDYINGLDLGFEQKVMLAKMEYPSYDEYNYEIIDYLNNNSSIDYDTMESILLELGFKVDANGNIRW